MTMGYLRLIQRCLGADGKAGAALLAGTGVRESDLANPSAEISSRDEIAERLGYSDPTSLSRACRRWFASRA